MGIKSADVIYYTEVKDDSQSKGKMLKKFYVLRTEIKIALETKGMHVTGFEDDDLALDLAFLVDLSEHLTDLN
ncbi:hypothetical protein TNCT_525231 [Trichonephila clavata]|uniref:Uncharacterized protein n=1 Tax=Trichonephila clavata TaxID=2740835 RepID=A0A8X6ICQ1_TRICU|nr:hypothetical protein TNCT_525231 [Trichonephila clavata]